MKTIKIILEALCAAALLSVGYLAGSRMCDKQTVEVRDYMPSPELTGWQLMMMAIAKTESEFNPQAVGKQNDVGVLQITPIYVREVNRILDTTAYHHTDAFSIKKSIEMYSIIQSYYNPEHDAEKAISLHNPNGDSVGYASKVLNNYRQLVRMEEVRKEALSL